MFGAWLQVHRATSTATPTLIASGGGSALLIWGVRAVNGAVGTVQVSKGAVGVLNIWEHLIADSSDSDIFPIPIEMGITNPTITIAGTATCYIYYTVR
jgi:hypothetical protein